MWWWWWWPALYSLAGVRMIVQSVNNQRSKVDVNWNQMFWYAGLIPSKIHRQEWTWVFSNSGPCKGHSLVNVPVIHCSICSTYCSLVYVLLISWSNTGLCTGHTLVQVPLISWSKCHSYPGLCTPHTLVQLLLKCWSNSGPCTTHTLVHVLVIYCSNYCSYLGLWTALP